MAGLSIYNRGGNPHMESLLRIRGLSTFDPDSGPLIVIDGVPMVTLHNLDPQATAFLSRKLSGMRMYFFRRRQSLLPAGLIYQPILFDNYNPVALLEQNINQGKRRNVNYNVKAVFYILKNLSLTVNAGQQFENNFNGTYYPINSFYIDYQRGGLAQGIDFCFRGLKRPSQVLENGSAVIKLNGQ